MTLTTADCRALLRPEQRIVSGKAWTVWRAANGQQIHAALDPDNVTLDVLRETIRQAGLCLGCDAEDCAGIDSEDPWCLEPQRGQA